MEVVEEPQKVSQEKTLEKPLFLGVETIDPDVGRIGFACDSLEDLKDQVAKRFNLAPPIKIFSYESDREIHEEEFSQLARSTIVVAASANEEDLYYKVSLKGRDEQRKKNRLGDRYDMMKKLDQDYEDIENGPFTEKEKEIKSMQRFFRSLHDFAYPWAPVNTEEGIKAFDDYISETLFNEDTNTE